MAKVFKYNKKINILVMHLIMAAFNLMTKDLIMAYATVMSTMIAQQFELV